MEIKRISEEEERKLSLWLRRRMMRHTYYMRIEKDMYTHIWRDTVTHGDKEKHG